MDGRPALDMAFLARQTCGDAKLASELLAAFKFQAEQILRRLQAAQPRSAGEKADDAHLLKGSARAVGAFRVSHLAERYEGLATSQPEAADAMLGDLAAAVSEVPDLAAATWPRPPAPGCG